MSRGNSFGLRISSLPWESVGKKADVTSIRARRVLVRNMQKVYRESSRLRQESQNLGDIIYTFRYRQDLPTTILETQPKDRGWLILGDGDARYRFRKISDATPEIISAYAKNQDQVRLRF